MDVRSLDNPFLHYVKHIVSLGFILMPWPISASHGLLIYYSILYPFVYDKSDAEPVNKTFGVSKNEEANAWTSHKTETGVVYYYNSVTGKSTYEKPSFFTEEVSVLHFVISMFDVFIRFEFRLLNLCSFSAMESRCPSHSIFMVCLLSFW